MLKRAADVSVAERLDAPLIPIVLEGDQPELISQVIRDAQPLGQGRQIWIDVQQALAYASEAAHGGSGRIAF